MTAALLLALTVPGWAADALDRAAAASIDAASAQTAEGAAGGAATLDGARVVQAVEVGPQGPKLEKTYPEPMPGFGRPLRSKPFAPAPVETKLSSPDGEGGGLVDGVTQAGFWMGFNIAEFPAYAILAQDNFFKPFGYLLFAVLLPAAVVFGLIGIVVAHIAVSRATDEKK